MGDYARRDAKPSGPPAHGAPAMKEMTQNLLTAGCLIVFLLSAVGIALWLLLSRG